MFWAYAINISIFLILTGTVVFFFLGSLSYYFWKVRPVLKRFATEGLQVTAKVLACYQTILSRKRVDSVLHVEYTLPDGRVIQRIIHNVAPKTYEEGMTRKTITLRVLYPEFPLTAWPENELEMGMSGTVSWCGILTILGVTLLLFMSTLEGFLFLEDSKEEGMFDDDSGWGTPLILALSLLLGAIFGAIAATRAYRAMMRHVLNAGEVVDQQTTTSRAADLEAADKLASSAAPSSSLSSTDNVERTSELS